MKKIRSEYATLSKQDQRNRLKEIALVFLKLGTIAFGGPAAHVAMMEDEIVSKRKWLEKDKFLDIYGATNLLPGPNSTELAIHLGLERGGWRGLILAGSCFILPAMLIILLISTLYNRFGTLPEVTGILYGIKPVIIAIILQALIRLGQAAIKNMATGILGGIIIILSFLGLHELILLFAAGLVMMLYTNRSRFLSHGTGLRSVSPFVALYAGSQLSQLLNQGDPDKALGLGRLFLTFLKIGSVLYGSGYVLLAF